MNQLVENPFESPQRGAQGAGHGQLVARENAEVLAHAVMAKRFPRDQAAACDRIRNAFTRASLAERAQYQFARGGTDIVGPSIRAAEAMSQQWGNMANGWREVSRSTGPDGVGISEVEAFCVDYESNSRESIQFQVRHWRDTKRGGYALSDERDIYELCANQAQRRKRACILAQIPGDVTEMAMDQAATTLRTSADTSPEAMQRMVAAFAPFGVTKEHIEKRIQRRLDTIQPAQVVALKRIYASLRDEMSAPGDWFDIAPPAPAVSGLDAVHAAATGAPVPTPTRKGSKKGAPTGQSEPQAGEQGEGATSPSTTSGEANGEPPGASGAGEERAHSPELQVFALRLLDAKTKEVADLLLDEARTTLQPEELSELRNAYSERWASGGQA